MQYTRSGPSLVDQSMGCMRMGCQAAKLKRVGSYNPPPAAVSFIRSQRPTSQSSLAAVERFCALHSFQFGSPLHCCYNFESALKVTKGLQYEANAFKSYVWNLKECFLSDKRISLKANLVVKVHWRNQLSCPGQSVSCSQSL